VEPFLEQIIADEANTKATREAAQSLLTGIQEQRNDLAEPRLYE
jgi:hypothetical protein